MSQNPYQPPLGPSVAIGVRSGRREDLKRVAVYQKGLLVCILVQLILFIAVFLIIEVSQFAIPPEDRFILLHLFNLAYSLVAITGTVFTFLLAIKVYNVVAGALLGLLTLIPCLGLIVLLIVNQKATHILQQNGIKVGLMGANLREI
jgi:hypothetical protein